MSLHLGNLSSCINRNELECVFWRFGRCYVQIKDKFGFVVYDFPANAERALKTLRGRKICGEPITISWSNRQPRPLKGVERGGRSYESHRRHFRRNDSTRLHSNARQDYRMGFKQGAADNARLNSGSQVDKAVSYHQDSTKGYIGDNQQNFTEDLHGEGRGVEADLVHRNSWGEQLSENGLDNGLGFDRYEPHHDNDTNDDVTAYAGSSPNLMKSPEKTVLQEVGKRASTNPENKKSQHTCHVCGKPGQKMHNCPHDNGSRIKKLSRFESSRQTDELNCKAEGEGELQQFAFKSQRSLQSSRGDVLRQDEVVGKSSSSRKHKNVKMSKNSSEAEGSQRSKKRDHVRSSMSDGDAVKYHVKKARGSVSSPIHSDYTAPCSQSDSKYSTSLSRSSLHRSRSVLSTKDSQSSSLSSGTRSQYSRLKGSSSRSSSPASLSLYGSLNQALPASLRKGQQDQKDSFVNASDLESKKILAEKGNRLHVDLSSYNQIIDNGMFVENENGTSSFKIAEDMNKDQFQQNDGNGYALPCASHVTGDLHTLPSFRSEFNGESLYAQNLGEKRDPISDIVVSEATTKNSEPEGSPRSSNAKSTSISSNEIYMALEHYGLEHPEENEKDLPVESFFGSARMWPWEIIYYRRLRKGPISTENYARRIAQNEQFNIVDKYVRSSSSWGEMSQADS